MAGPSAKVFNIPASAPFLPTLIRALRDGKLIEGFPQADDPLSLARATLYLPTRRACRLARDAFLDAGGTKAAILPRIVPLGLIDEDEIALSSLASAQAGGLETPETLSPFRRNVSLAGLILAWAKSQGMRGQQGAALVANTPTAAFKLAGDLGHLMDDMATRGVDWKKLDDLVPAGLDEYWQKTLEFLKIAREAWPAFLAEANLIEPAERQNALIVAETERLRASNEPVIAAGSTGSIPSTATLLKTIATLPNGALVLPGLDTDLDDESWSAIGKDNASPSHPQYAMQALLAQLGIDRDAVTALAAPAGRELLVSEAMRPAEQTDLWEKRLRDADVAPRVAAGMGNIAVVEAANAEEEALAIAVALRETVGDKAKTAALITPDRTLARRVLAALARWNIEVIDSAGQNLSTTPAGIFAELVASAALGGLQPVALLAMLKHPLCRLDRQAIETLERAVLRGPRPKRGTAGLVHSLATFRAGQKKLHRSDPRTALTDTVLDAADALAKELQDALAPLERIASGNHTFASLAEAHRKAVANLAGELDTLTDAFDQIIDHGSLVITREDYAELFHAVLEAEPVRRPATLARVQILGTLESRLQHVDRAVLGGLVEGSWPPETRADPWLSRPMRLALGLDLPERRIGLSAHDFAQALGARDVVLSRAARIAGAPTVPSRFVQRLAAVAGEERWTKAVQDGAKYLGYARTLDQPEKMSIIKMPEPRPPVAARPTQLSVTDIENWLRDPYTIYAKHVLRLYPLDAVDTPPGAADRGTIIHDAIGEFTQRFPAEIPADAFAQLQALGEKHFAPLADFPEARAFWWPRFLRIARWLVDDHEPARRPNVKAIHAERFGRLPIPLGETTFTLTARADRIEQRDDGSFAVIDYKTGTPPTDSQVKSGLSPQLTLEAAMLRGGAFADIGPVTSVSQLFYIALRGGEPAGEEKIIDFKDSDPNTQADDALKRLIGVAARFAEVETPYRPLSHPMWKRRRYGDYDHLARAKEWSQTGDALEEE